MKRVAQLPEPEALKTYRTAQPDGTWNELRDDSIHGGMAAHRAIKRTSLAQQRSLCAFCEMAIGSRVPLPDDDTDNPNARIEHFHPKGDTSGGTNWHLVWSNLWAVCDGGDKWPPRGEPLNPRFQVEPRPENLSCDAFKNHQIVRGDLKEQPEGLVLSPDQIPAFPALFRYGSDGAILPNEKCDTLDLQPNHYASARELATKTIKHLNLNCPRLSRLREQVLNEIEEQLAELRLADPDNGPQRVREYAKNIFADVATTPWPEFFSLVRWVLGEAAEERLRQIRYVG